MPKVSVPLNKGGFPFGSYILSNGMPGRVVGRSNKNLTFVEVWGFGHDIGDCCTSSCVPISKEEFDLTAAEFGYTDTTSGIERVRQWDDIVSASCAK